MLQVTTHSQCVSWRSCRSVSGLFIVIQIRRVPCEDPSGGASYEQLTYINVIHG